MGDAIKILFVEDQEADAELITRALRRSGAVLDARRVDSHAALITQLEEFRPDIVLSDFTLPGFGGLEALEMVRSHDSELPFVFVSGTLGEDRAIDALKRGATDYVLKNSLGRLPSAVTRALVEAANHRARLVAEKEVHRNARRLHDIVEASQDWIWELDADARFTFSNSAVHSILGIASEAVLQLPFADFLHPEDRIASARLLPDPALGERAVRGRRARWMHIDGSHRWLESSATVVLQGEQFAGYRGNLRDVTRQLEHEARIARLNRIQILLSSVNAAVAQEHDEGKLLQEICRLAVEKGGYARAIVALQDAPGSELRPVAWNSALDGGIETLMLPLALRTRRDELTLAGAALRTGEPAKADDLEPRDFDQPRIRHQLALRKLGVRALAVLPLTSEPRALGVLSLESREPAVFDEEEQALLVQVAMHISQSLQHSAREETLHFLSWFDPLTQLARRELFCERLALLCSGAESSAAVVALHLESIGMVNDSLGRQTGDDMLRLVANRLRTRLGNADRLSHLGGGTFAVALGGADAEGAGLVQARMQLREVFAESFVIGGREFDMKIRTGVARYPIDASSATTLVQNAETALRRAKTAGLEDYDYTVTLNEQLVQSMLFGQRLHRALAHSQFLLHYQPVVEIESRRIVGAEALVRWLDPERGLVPPIEFIPLLEESGQIVDVGQWVLEQVARDSRLLGRKRPGRLHLAVNISALQLRREDFVERLLQVAMEVESHSAQLEIEITESMLMQDLDASIAKLADLRAAGVCVSIDDFGTGYSSLAMLAKLPIDYLKIDRSFIAPLIDDEASMTVVSTVIGLARSFRLKSIGEGIETEEQLKLLRLMKCDLGQGYLFGRPMPLNDLIECMANEPPAADTP
jgi:diguanylate cyclase (GGDEF)-like protein/PAS domain S-box-containing protein